jgi:hypothetical protein
MKTVFHAATRAAVIAFAITVAPLGTANATSLDNLERERAKLLSNYLDPSLAAGDRQRVIEPARRRLVDLERMVLRDDSLAAKPNAAVRGAFENYDLTFLVHASAEKRVTILEIWLREVGVSTSTTMAARVGRR